MFVWLAATFTVPASTHLPLTLVLPKDQLRFVASRLVCGDIMIVSHIRVIWHALLACLLLAGSAPQIQHSASASLLSKTSGDGSSVWYTWMHEYVPPHPKNLLQLCVSYCLFKCSSYLGVCYLFSSAWFLLAIHYSCFFHTHNLRYFAFRLFPMLSFYFPPASLLYLLWAVLWCHVAGPAQLSDQVSWDLFWVN